MGRATIVENLGAGLYRARLTYNTAPIIAELEAIEKAKADAIPLLEQATKTRDWLEAGVKTAAEALDAVIVQWRADILTANEPAPPLTGDDGSGGSSAQDNLLANAVNALRADLGLEALEVDAALTTAARAVAQYLANSGETHDHYPADVRCEQAGFAWDAEVGTGEAIACGQVSADSAVSAMRRNSTHYEQLSNPLYTHFGAGYRYSMASPYGYHWAVVFSAPGLTSTTSYLDADPAQQAADDQATELDAVELPKTDDLSPPQLADATAAYGLAIGQYNAAADAVARLLTEASERDARIALLEMARDKALTSIHVWSCLYQTDLAVGSAVSTAEVPGWYEDLPMDHASIINGVSITYQERAINIVPTECGGGALRDAQTLSPESLFVDLALEPGWLRWKPRWRYGVITAIADSGLTCSVNLTLTAARSATGLGSGLWIDAAGDTSIAECSIAYGCAGVYSEGDEVLIHYQGNDRALPRVIGWRREPRQCADPGRIQWGEVRL